MLKRMSLVVVLAATLVLLMAGIAFAEEKTLDQAVCEDATPWANGSVIPDGSWDAGTNTCSAGTIDIEVGDKLIIPAGVTLSASQLNAKGEVLNDGDVNVSSTIIASDVFVNNGIVDGWSFWVNGELINNGTVAHDRLTASSGASVTNNATISVLELAILAGGALDNYGPIDTLDLTIDGTLTNFCDGTVDYEFITGEITDGGCSDVTTPTTTPSTTTTVAAPTTSVVGPSTTVAAPTTTVAVAAADETLPFTGLDADGGLGYFASLLTVAGLAILIAAARRGRTDDN